MSEMSFKDGCNAHFYLLDLKHVPATLFLGLSLDQKRQSSYLLCGRELTLSFLELRFGGPKTEKHPLKCIPTEYSPFPTAHKKRDLYTIVLHYMGSFHT